MDYPVLDVASTERKYLSRTESRVRSDVDGGFDLDIALRFGEGFDLPFAEIDFARGVFREELDLVAEGFFEPAPSLVSKVRSTPENSKASVLC